MWPSLRDKVSGIIALAMYYPVGLNLNGARALVVGGGKIALRKARALLRSGARVTVVSPEFSAPFERKGVRRVRRLFRAGDVRGALLAIAATDDPHVNRAVHRACVRRGVLVNVVDVPELSTFVVPSVVRRGPVTLAISTEGKSPALAKALRRDLERLYPNSLGRFAASVGRARRRLLRVLPPSARRTKLLKLLAKGFTFRKAKAR